MDQEMMMQQALANDPEMQGMGGMDQMEQPPQPMQGSEISEEEKMSLKGQLAEILERLRPELGPAEIVNLVDEVAGDPPSMQEDQYAEPLPDQRQVEQRDVLAGRPADMGAMGQQGPNADPRMLAAMQTV